MIKSNRKSSVLKLIFAIKRKVQFIFKINPYELFANFFSNVIGGSIILKINNIPGEFEIDCRSHLLTRILVTKEYEYSTVKSILKYIDKEKDAINIGANIGLFTNLMASLLNVDNNVLAIEPTENAYKYLLSNTLRNGNDKKVIGYNGIVSDKPGDYKLNFIEGKEEYSSIGEISHSSVLNNVSKSVDVKGETIDNLVNSYKLIPGILVIDVEGAEFQVLSGSIKTIQKYKPIIITELDDSLLEKLNSSSKEVINLLTENHYQVTDIENNKISYPFSGNILAIPI